jgi:hypothetical protein
MAEGLDSVTQTVRRVVDDVRELFREEVALARAEIRQEMTAFASAGVQVGAGAVLGLMALLFVFHAAALGLAEVAGWAVWASYLLVGLVVGVVGALAVVMGVSKARRTPAVPPQTLESLQENKEWLKHRMTSEPR